MTAAPRLDPLATVPPSLRLRPLVALLFAWVGLVGVRTFAFAAWHGTDSLFALAMLDLSALFLATIAFVVLPLSMRGLGALVLAFGFGLPLAGVGWFLETTVSAEVSLLGAFVGLHALSAGGIAGGVWTRTEFFGFALLLCVGLGAGGLYGAAEQTSWPDAALLLAPLTLVGWGGPRRCGVRRLRPRRRSEAHVRRSARAARRRPNGDWLA